MTKLLWIYGEKKLKVKVMSETECCHFLKSCFPNFAIELT